MVRYMQINENGFIFGDYYLSGPVEREDYCLVPDSWPIDLVGRLYDGERLSEKKYCYDEMGSIIPQE